jgi:integrase
MALTTAYAAGLRVSEVVALKVSDIDSSRMVMRIEPGKGGKERHTMLSVSLLGILRGQLGFFGDLAPRPHTTLRIIYLSNIYIDLDISVEGCETDLSRLAKK